jgi:hypothetical protein
MNGLRRVVSPELLATILSGLVITGVLVSGVLAGPGDGLGSTGSPEPAASRTPAPGLQPELRAALVTARAIGERLAGRAGELEEAIDGEPEDGGEIAAILRAVSQTAASATEVPQLLQRHRATRGLGEDLAAFYVDIVTLNDETLGASIQDAGAYIAGAEALLERLASLPGFDDRMETALAGPRPAASGLAAGPTASGGSPRPTPRPSQPASEPAPSVSVPRPSVDPSAAPTGPDRLANGTFDTDLDGWLLERDAIALATAVHDPAGGVDSGAARIETTTTSPARAGLAWVTDVEGLAAGTAYRVQLRMRAESPREVRVRLTDAAGLTTTARVLSVRTTWDTVAFDIVQLVGEPAVRLAIDLGRSDATVWIDEVAVRATAGGAASAP